MRKLTVLPTFTLLCSALFCSPMASASSLDLYGLLCNIGSGGSTAFSLCGDTAVGGEVPGNIFGGTVKSPDFKNTVGGASETFGAGAQGLSAQAFAAASFGHLRVLTLANNPIGDAPDIFFRANSVARAQTQMVDSAIVDGLTGPIQGRVSLDVTGSFAGNGDLRIGLFLFSSLQGSLINFQTSRFTGFSSPIDQDFNFTVVDGEQLFFRMFMDAGAFAATSNGKTPVSTSFVDARNSAILQIQLFTPGASLISASGHDYSVAPVPVPGVGLLMGPLSLATLYLCRRAWRA